MVFEMRHTISFRRPAVLTAAALALSLITASQASAQGYDANKLAGKSFPEVNKLLGKPVIASSASASKDIIYATYKTPGTLVTRVVFAIQTGKVKQVQIIVLGHSEQPEDVLKRFKLTLGVNPEKNPRKMPPALGLTSTSLPPSSPWQTVHVGYGLGMAYQQEITDYLKQQRLPYASTYFWTIMLTPRRGARVSNQVQGGGG